VLCAERPTPILCCGGGTPHKPPILRPDGYVLHEGTECAQFLIAQVSVGRPGRQQIECQLQAYWCIHCCNLGSEKLLGLLFGDSGHILKGRHLVSLS